MKTIPQQVQAMRQHWPAFEVAEDRRLERAIWFGPLAGLERTYRLMIEYGLPRRAAPEMCYRFPVVRVLSPALELRFDAVEEAPLPHVYFSGPDFTLSPLCLFDIEAGEWSHDDLIALTTVPWAADWLACYECWLATGRWYGGGRHAARPEEKAS